MKKRRRKNMGFEFGLEYSKYFLDQWAAFGAESKELIEKKLYLTRQNPFRFPKHRGYTRVFKIKMTVDNVYSRLMYAVFMPDEGSITVLGVFPRKHSYKDFDRIFGYLRNR